MAKKETVFDEGPQDPEQNSPEDWAAMRKTKRKPKKVEKPAKKVRSLRQIILAGLGKAWMFWPPRLAAKKRAKHPTKAGWYICEMCKGEREKIEIDHVVPCIKPSEGFTSWDAYISARFVESASQLQSLCHECHGAKSKQENAERRAKKGLTLKDIKNAAAKAKPVKDVRLPIVFPNAAVVTEEDLDEFAKRFPNQETI